MTFEIAALLHMTVAELRQRISSAEFVKWIAWLHERNRREAAAIKKAGRGLR